MAVGLFEAHRVVCCSILRIDSTCIPARTSQLSLATQPSRVERHLVLLSFPSHSSYSLTARSAKLPTRAFRGVPLRVVLVLAVQLALVRRLALGLFSFSPRIVLRQLLFELLFDGVAHAHAAEPRRDDDADPMMMTAPK